MSRREAPQPAVLEIRLYAPGGSVVDAASVQVGRRRRWPVRRASWPRKRRRWRP